MIMYSQVRAPFIFLVTADNPEAFNMLTETVFALGAFLGATTHFCSQFCTTFCIGLYTKSQCFRACPTLGNRRQHPSNTFLNRVSGVRVSPGAPEKRALLGFFLYPKLFNAKFLGFHLLNNIFMF